LKKFLCPGKVSQTSYLLEAAELAYISTKSYKHCEVLYSM